ncbi:hypothetical protein KRX51_03225 [Corynebacterium sp. TAE3-ERU12]|uniref:hypothetical protein n=1 Tax=Corynebacterium sp. TAE3-ERU12 TaxID=2849491 RepID=UPI001C479D17|nr:hypothetical protein [Corynebacterium sp. TAE3-ERU12]MBV7294930.1 hypothetical protein [Corynebacterium sp. TAE3-ERU12]
MTVNVKNAFIGSPPIDGGVFYRAPLGTPLPKSATEELDAAFEDHGAVGDDGIAVSNERNTSDIKMFGGGTFIDVQESYDETIVLTLLEDDNDAVLKTTFGDHAVKKTEATAEHGVQRTVYHTEQQLPLSSFVVKSVYGDKSKTYVVERGRVANVSEIKDVHSDVTRHQITIKTFKPVTDELKGGYVLELRDDGEASSDTVGDE